MSPGVKRVALPLPGHLSVVTIRQAVGRPVPGLAPSATCIRHRAPSPEKQSAVSGVERLIRAADHGPGPARPAPRHRGQGGDRRVGRGRLVRSERLTLPKPAIIRLVKFVHVPRRFRRQVTNTFLFARDGYRCQYCHRSQADLRHRECLTRDHLIPLSRGGDNEWTNVVTACSSCNTRKGNHLPEECGMHPDARAARAALRAPLVGGPPAHVTQAKYIKLSTATRRCGRSGGTDLASTRREPG